MSYNAKAQKKYRDKSIQFSVNYRPTDIQEGKRLKEYLQEKGISANKYIKTLIKEDLDKKNFIIDDE